MVRKKILVIQTAFLGDLLLGTVLFQRLRVLFPDGEITLVCRKGLGQFILQLGLVDRYFEVEKGRGQSYKSIADTLHADSFDFLLCAHQSFRSALFSRAIRSSEKISFQKWWNFLFFNQRIKWDQSLPEALRQLSLLQNFDSETANKLKHYISEKERVPQWAYIQNLNLKLKNQNERDSFKNIQKSIAIFPGSVWETKKWTEQGFKEVAQHFLDQGFKVIFLGSKDEVEICQRIQNQLQFKQDQLVDKSGQLSLLESFEMLSSVNAVITNDSGGQHMASLFQIPTVTIFGPTVTRFGYQAWNPNSLVVENTKVNCRPCGSHGHRVCPIGTHECMKTISSRSVIEATQQLLEKFSP